MEQKQLVVFNKILSEVKMAFVQKGEFATFSLENAKNS